MRLSLIGSRLCEAKCCRDLEGFREGSKPWRGAKEKMITHFKDIEEFEPDPVDIVILAC
jgi:hypothetical protein